MRVGLAQIKCTAGDVEANLATIGDFVAKAAEQRCDAVWFPELSDTGYALSQIENAAGAWPGKAHDTVASLAGQHRITVGIGLTERVGLRVYNALAVFDDTGKRVSSYRKAHLFDAGEVRETACFTPGPATGDKPGVTVNLDDLPHGLSVCYDLRFPELYRHLVDHGATVLINVTAWPAKRAEHWDILTRARAVENQAYFIGVGRVGEDEGIVLAGRSRVVAPTGELLVEGSTDQAELLVTEFDPAKVAEFRNAVPSLRARRPELWR